MIKGVIFDMDGVLIDSQPIHFKSDIMTMSEYGCNVKEDDIINYAGTTTKTRFGLYKENFGLNGDIEEMAKRREELTLELFNNENICAIDGVKELLEDLKKNDIKIALASSSPYKLIYTVLDRTGIRQYFDKVISGEDVKNGKPAPDVFLAAAELLGLTNNECVVVEDSTNGIKAGVAANMKVLAYFNPTSGNQDLSLATVAIDDFKKINCDFIKNLAK